RHGSPPPYSVPDQTPRESNLNLIRSTALPEFLRTPASFPEDRIAKEVTSALSSTTPPSPSSMPHTPLGSDAGHSATSPLHPRVAVILGVDRRWYIPLLVCRALSTLPAAWWGLRCAFTFLAELLHIRPGMGREGWAAAIVGSVGQEWDVERRFRVTEVALAIMWCCASAYLSYFFADCMMSRWQASELHPASCCDPSFDNKWVNCIHHLLGSLSFRCIVRSSPSSTSLDFHNHCKNLSVPSLTFVYHATQNHATIKRETAASLLVVSAASFISMSSLLLQLHLTRENEPEVPVFVITRKLWDWAVTIFLRMRVADDRIAGEL
ncbi:hypothetical protein N7478_001590, partial [Penicillium angulare]|uniref:uncharacterized protein n=1 Tax=Penicillium angulare TaxID=116970 RepID=UPI002540F1A1